MNEVYFVRNEYLSFGEGRLSIFNTMNYINLFINQRRRHLPEIWKKTDRQTDIAVYRDVTLLKIPDFLIIYRI